ncbi:hypothetical protein [Vibrio phage RYC]|nr:hypothetical protein [Vibrio phage RYC]
MKFKLIAGTILGSVLLTGCMDPNMKGWKNKATAEEVAFLTLMRKANSCSIEYLDPVKISINKRDKRPSNDAAPFADVEMQVKTSDYVLNMRNKVCSRFSTLQGLYKGSTGRDLFSESELVDSEPKIVEEVPVPVEVTEEEVRDQVVEATVTTDKGTFLSPSQILEINEVAKNCDRAKRHISMTLDYGEKLTTEHYNQVQNLSVECAMYQLNKTIQGD